jgi:hypothetical protein
MGTSDGSVHLDWTIVVVRARRAAPGTVLTASG